MASTFFKTLKFLEEKASEGYLSPRSSSLLSRLTAFIESGRCSDSASEKFIMANFRLSGSEMLKKWNRVHLGSEKKEETLRGQISLISRYLCSLFGMTPDELNAVFINDDIEGLRGVSILLDAFDLGDFDISERFPLVSQYKLLPSDSTDSAYKAEECEKEIQFLKTLDRSVIEGLLSEVDMDKLIYVLQTIREPLVKDTYKKLEGKSRKVKTATVNIQKLEFYKIFGIVKPKTLKPVSVIEVPGVSDVEAPGVSGVEVPGVPSRPFALEMSDTLMRVLAEGLERYKALPSDKKERLEAKSTEESRSRCHALLELFTLEGFKRQFNKLNPVDVS